MAEKTSMALLLGGTSAEHDISLRSARNIYAAIDQRAYSITLLGIDRAGTWFELPTDFFESMPEEMEVRGKALALVPGQGVHSFRYLDDLQHGPEIEVVFPITHGPYGEDGTLQGLLRQLHVPFVGPDVLGSAVAMDKDVAKRLIREADLLTAAYLCFSYYEKEAIDYMAVVNQLGSPLFIKPANMGSSVGVAKAATHAEFTAAVEKAFHYDHKIIVEEFIEGRELECAVLGNATLATSGIGEIGMNQGFYDYDSKYEDPNAAALDIPAKDLDDQTIAKLVLVAKHAYRALSCEGLSRVDMFLTEAGAVYVNEVNTLPGFTDISMYPALWRHAGTETPELITELLQLAMERGQRAETIRKATR